MSRERCLQLEKYGISTYEYLKMRYLCLGYNDRKKKINDIYSIKSPNLQGTGHGVSQPTEHKAEVAMECSKENDLIDELIREVCSKYGYKDAEKYLFMHVTTKNAKKYDLIDRYQFGIEWHIFVKMRTEFYVELARRLNFI